MRRSHLMLLPVALVAILVLAVPAGAEPSVVERDTEVHGATRVTFTSSFEDRDYTQGRPVTFTVTWSVSAGTASYAAVAARGPGYTPRGPDPADGTQPTARQPGRLGDQSVDVTVTFAELHYDADRDVAIGNAHLSLLLVIDDDGDGAVDTRVANGFNLHVEDAAPADSSGADADATVRDHGQGERRGGPPPWAVLGRRGHWGWHW